MRKRINYYIYSPGGNDTAIVVENNFDDIIKKKINNEIMSKHKNIEQVGFICGKSHELYMAGGEFCGNASRCAAYYYLNGNDGEIKLNTSIGNIDCGMINNKAWAEIPVVRKDMITKIDLGIVRVNLGGIEYIVLDCKQSERYLKNIKGIKNSAKKILQMLNIEFKEAIGVIFTEKINNKIKIHPVIWVMNIDTVFYETACGSGTVATAIIQNLENNENLIEVIQPSNHIITAKIIKENNQVSKVIIKGSIITDNCLRTLIITI